MVNDWDNIKNIFKRFKDLASVGIANIFAMVISSIFWLYIAALIGDEGYGNIGFLLATANIVGGISLLGSSDTLVVYRAKEVKLQSAIFLVVIIVAVVASLATFVFLQSSEVSIYIIGYVIFTLILYEALGSKNYRNYSFFFISQRILAIVLALILYFIIGLEGIVLGYALSFLPFSIYIYKTFRSTPINFQLVRPRFSFMMNSYARSLMQTFSASLDKLIIFPLFGASLLGNYYLGFQVFNVLAILPSIVFQYVLPQDSSGTSHTKLKKLTVIITAALSGIAIISSPIILPIFFPDFIVAVVIVQIMSIALVPSSINQMFISKLLGNEKIKIVIIGQGIGLTGMIGGIFVLGDIFGIIGAAMGFTIGAVTQTIYFFIIRRLSKK